MLENYKNSNGFLSQRLVLKLLEHIVFVFQDNLLFKRKEHIIKNKLYFKVINNYQIFDRKLPELIAKIEIRTSLRPSNTITQSPNSERHATSKQSNNTKLSRKGSNQSNNKRQFQTATDRIHRKIVKKAYLEACTKIKVQFFNISNYFFTLYMESLKIVFGRFFKSHKKVSQKEFQLLSQIPDMSKLPELQTRRYSDLKLTRVLENMIRIVERVLDSISFMFTGRLQRFVLIYFTQSVLLCFLEEVQDLHDQRRYKDADGVFKKLRRDKEQFRRFLKDSPIEEMGRQCLEIMDEIYFVSKSCEEDIVDDLLHLKRISRNYLSNRDLELILEVNPNLRKMLQKDKQRLANRLNKNLYLQRVTHDSAFRKNLRAMATFIICLKRVNYEDADKDNFITVSQIEKTGFKFGVKVGLIGG